MLRYAARIAAAITVLATLVQAHCPAGTYVGRDLNCHKCAPGSYSQGFTSRSHPTQCTPCSPGSYAKNSGSSQCSPCGQGSFSSYSGATKCCKCCAGFYTNKSRGADKCNQCPSGFPFSGPGTSNIGGCHHNHRRGTSSGNSCSIGGRNHDQCPNPECGPEPSHKPKAKRSDSSCPKGSKLCPRLSGTGGNQCVNVANDAESCGGCVGFDSLGNDDTGRDCTAIPAVSVSRCVRGQCVIDTCRKGYKLNATGTACVPEALSAHKVTVQNDAPGIFSPSGDL
ncbi:hypothetical protein FRB99_001962 [Tulasnella sp. 403]|nr:hypothetical protein FRB99_001962 [Tulasnella sp. 403]